MGVNKTSIGTYGQARKVGSFLGVVDYDDTTSLGALEFPLSRNSKATEFSDGLIKEVDENVPRFEDGALLLEPQSTNLITYSEDFSDSSWDKNGTVSVLANQSISPDGLNNATNLSGATGDALTNVLRDTFFGLNNPASFSVYVKSNGATSVTLIIRNGISGNISRNVFSVTNEWVRVSITALIQDGQIGIGGTDGDLFIWGAQLEELPYPTSYIKTEGSTATRIADVVSGADNENIFNSEEGVLYFQGKIFENDNSVRRLSLSDGTTTNSIYVEITDTYKAYVIRSGGTSQFSLLDSDTSLDFKIALTWILGEFSFWINGVKVGSTNTGTLPTNIKTLNFDRGDGSVKYYGKVRDLQVFNRVLTDTQLQQLTS